MTLLRQGRSGSALLDQLVAEAALRRKVFFPQPASMPSPSPPPLSLPKPKPCQPQRHIGIYRSPYGQWIWRVRSKDRVVYWGTCCTAEEAHFRYCEAKGVIAYPDRPREEKSRVLAKRREPEYGAPPVIRTMGWLTVVDIQRVVAWHSGWPFNEIVGYSRIAELVCVRQVAMYLSKILTSRSFPEIGRMFGRDHSTVHHAVRRIHDAITGENTATRLSGPRGLDPALAAQVEALKQRLLP